MSFTDEDRLFPVYCTRCRAHVPRAVSDASGGLCEDCQLQDVAAADQAIADAQKQAAQDAYNRYHTDAHMGACDKCGSKNLRQFDVYNKNQANTATIGAAGAAAAGAVGAGAGLGVLGAFAGTTGCFVIGLMALIFLPCLILIAIFAAPLLLIALGLGFVATAGVVILVAAQMTKKKIGTSRECLNCGHRWPV